MGLPARLSYCIGAKTVQELLQRIHQAFIRTHNWLSGLPDLNPLDCKLWVTCVKGHGLPKASQKPGEPEAIPPVGRRIDSHIYSASGNSRMDSMSQGLRRDIGRPF